MFLRKIFNWFRSPRVKTFLVNLLPYKIRFFIVRFYHKINKIIPSGKELGFEIHIAEHCNLNCKCCSHFSPLAKDGFLSLQDFEKQIKRISQLTKKLRYVLLVGGEPLLHPQVCGFIEIVRKYFPDTPIELTTNGILLPKMPDSFWQTVKKHNCHIRVSGYPIDIHFEKIRKEIDSGIKITYDYNPILHNDGFSKIPLDLDGKQNIRKNFFNCSYANSCFTLRDGRLYTCSIAAHIRFFNQYFQKNLLATEQDSINIYEVKNIKEILTFLRKPIPFCRYCKINNIQYKIPWGVSKKDISEWN